MSGETETSILVSVGRDKRIRILDLESGTEHANIKHSHALHSIHTLDPETPIAAVSGWDACVTIWDLKEQELQSTFRGHSRKTLDLAFVPSSSLVVSTSLDTTIRMWALGQPEALAVLEAHSGWVECVDYVDFRDVLVSGSDDCSLCVWDLEGARLRHQIDPAHDEGVTCLEHDDEHAVLFSGSADRSVKMFDLTSFESTGELAIKDMGPGVWITSMTYSPSKQLLAVGTGDGCVSFFDRRKNTTQVGKFRAHNECVESMCEVVVDGNPYVATGARDGEIMVSGDEPMMFRAEGAVMGLAVLKNAQVLGRPRSEE